MAALAPLVGLPVAFKLGSVPAASSCCRSLTYAAFRLMGFRFPGPLLGAAAAARVPVPGGEPDLGRHHRQHADRRVLLHLRHRLRRALPRRRLPRLHPRRRPLAGRRWSLAVTALAHGYAVLWAGLSATYFLYGARRPAAHAALAAGGGRPLPSRWPPSACCRCSPAWGWTTPYDDPWITVTPANLVPAAPVAAVRGRRRSAWAPRWCSRRRTGGPDHRLLFLLHAAAGGRRPWPRPAPPSASSTCASCPSRSSPCAWPGRRPSASRWRRLRAPLPGRAGPRVLLAIVYGDVQLAACCAPGSTGTTRASRPRSSGRPSARAGRRACAAAWATRGSPSSTAPVHEKAGSIRMYETLPFFSGRSTLEGVYNQASLQTHSVYYLASELGATSPNPFRSREYSRFDTDAALRPPAALQRERRGGGQRPAGRRAASARPDVEPLFARAALLRLPPVRDRGPGYVEPLALRARALLAARLAGQGLPLVHARAAVARRTSSSPTTRASRCAEPDEWLAPPEVPLPAGVEVQRDGRARGACTSTPTASAIRCW